MMNQKNLLSLLILDLVVMCLGMGLFIFRYRSLVQAVPEISSAAPAPLAETPRVSLPKVVPVPAVSSVPDTPGMSDDEPQGSLQSNEPRHIAFAYRNSRAKRVQIMGDFNNWSPRPMNLGLNYRWSATLDIPPGDYAYNFVVDGKPVRDPNNPKVCNAGRGFPNSFLKVNSRADDQHKTH